MNRIVTLDEFIIHRQKDFSYASGELTGLLRDIGVAAKIVNREVNKAGLVNILGVEGITRDVTDQKRAHETQEKLIGELKKAMTEVRTLSGLLPICASCKKIRDDKGYWSQIESYISEHSEAEFSHGICPDCAKKLYSEIKY